METIKFCPYCGSIKTEKLNYPFIIWQIYKCLICKKTFVILPKEEKR